MRFCFLYCLYSKAVLANRGDFGLTSNRFPDFDPLKVNFLHDLSSKHGVKTLRKIHSSSSSLKRLALFSTLQSDGSFTIEFLVLSPMILSFLYLANNPLHRLTAM